MNSYFKNRLKIKKSISKKSLDRAEYLSSLGISSDVVFARYLYVNDGIKKISGKFDDTMAAKIASSREVIKSDNDVCRAIILEKIRSKGINKVAYPNNSSFESKGVKDEFDLKRWTNLVHKIYAAVESGDMSSPNAIDYYGDSLEPNEAESFKKWIKYYSDGNHKKYSNEEVIMKKDAVYGMSLLGAGEYDRPSTFDDSAKAGVDEARKSKDFDLWKSRLHGAIRRIDKLMRSSNMDKQSYREMGEMLLNLSDKVVGLSPVTACDLTYRAANMLNKIGRKSDANILRKIAQEAPEVTQSDEEPLANPDAQSQQADQGGAAASQPLVEDSQTEQAAKELGIGNNNSAEPVPLEKIDTPDPRPGEYDKIMGEVSLDDASEKLDEVAGMLADRRIIRLLAEFDIMLDKLGVASMFPELAESQSKLIDGYSYALTRVTKMMGQLSNAKSFVDSNPGSIPGAVEKAIAPGEGAAFQNDSE